MHITYQIINTLFGKCTNGIALCNWHKDEVYRKVYHFWGHSLDSNSRLVCHCLEVWSHDIYLASASFSLSLKWGW